MEAGYLCPAAPVYLRDPMPHLGSYLGALPAISAGQLAVEGLSSSAELAGARRLASALELYWLPQDSPAPSDQPEHAVVRRQQAASLLERPDAQAQLSQALCSLSAGRPAGLQPFSLQHLQYVCHEHAVEAALRICAPSTAPGSGLQCLAAQQQLQRQPSMVAAAAAARSAAAALVRLEPDNPRSPLVAAHPLLGSGFLLPDVATLPNLLKGIRQAQQRGSGYYAVFLTGAAANACSRAESGTAPAELQAVEAALREAEAAVPRCRRVLPQRWVSVLESCLPIFRDMLQAARLRSATFQAVRSGDPQAIASANRHWQANLQAFASTVEQKKAQVAAADVCTGCGKHAVGLRACARCRAARYCSRECQAAHWPQHKRECRPA